MPVFAADKAFILKKLHNLYQYLIIKKRVFGDEYNVNVIISQHENERDGNIIIFDKSLNVGMLQQLSTNSIWTEIQVQKQYIFDTNRIK